jgi:5-methylcytosine-specific restriction endonuclease McrA
MPRSRLGASPLRLLVQSLQQLTPLVRRALIAAFPWTARTVFGYSLTSTVGTSRSTEPAVVSPEPDPERWRHEDGFEVPQSAIDEFYESWQWKNCNYRFRRIWKEKCEPICMCCRIDEMRRRLDVDHILPLRYHWTKRRDWNNLQVLCTDCNQGKGSWDTTDHRPAYFKTHVAAIVPRSRSRGRADG